MSSETNSMDQMPKKSPLSFQVDLKKFEKATDEEKRQQDVMSESVSFFKDGMRKLMKNPLAVGSIIVLIAIIAMILIVPHVVPYKYSQIITVNGSRDKAAGNMAPFTYSEKELAYMAEGGEGYNIYTAKMLVRHDADGKLYLYDIIRTKKETSTPSGLL